ncbi:MAG: preprotein translocase subunit SecY [Oscillospiraceae bacterium]|nr:preprotein translocase subunit SecY [Oscillospiraceae bacterium]
MIQTMRNAWKVPELRGKLLFTVFALLIFRLGSAVPVPFINVDMLSDYMTAQSASIFGLLNVMSGDAFAQATVFALSIQPYINSSIIIQLLTIAIPALERLQKEGGEEGKKKLAAITRYATVGIALIQAFGFYTMLRVGSGGTSFLSTTGIWPAFVIIAAFVAGSAFLMWLGEQITEFGIGNGISIILFAGIVARGPSMVGSMIDGVRGWIAKSDPATSLVLHPAFILLIVAGMLLLVAFIVFMDNSERRIPVQYAKRVVGRKMYFFSYFYNTIQFNPIEVSNNLKKNGGFVPGFRPGKPTSDFLSKVVSRITMFGALYLAVVALLPTIVGNIMLLAGSSAGRSLAIGGTSVIIVVGVALETVKALEAQLMMRHYKGFLE